MTHYDSAGEGQWVFSASLEVHNLPVFVVLGCTDQLEHSFLHETSWDACLWLRGWCWWLYHYRPYKGSTLLTTMAPVFTGPLESILREILSSLSHSTTWTVCYDLCVCVCSWINSKGNVIIIVSQYNLNSLCVCVCSWIDSKGNVIIIVSQHNLDSLCVCVCSWINSKGNVTIIVSQHNLDSLLWPLCVCVHISEYDSWQWGWCVWSVIKEVLQ